VIHCVKYFPGYALGKLLQDVSYVVVVQCLGNGNYLLRVHSPEELRLQFIRELRQDLTLSIDVDKSPEYVPFSGGRGFQQVRSISGGECIEHPPNFGSSATVQGKGKSVELYLGLCFFQRHDSPTSRSRDYRPKRRVQQLW